MANIKSTTNIEAFSPERLEVQKTLAKLLGEENMTVTVGDYQTAFFNCKTRELGLPAWSFTDCPNPKANIDLMTGHEVGHARHTPEDGIDRFKKRFPGVPFSICNIIEDIRIERKILEDYPGLLHSFKAGYDWFVEADKFEIEGKDISKMGFADRLNLRAKTRRTDIAPLSEDEEAFYQECLAADSYDEVLDLVERAVEMTKDDPQPKEQPQDQEQSDCEQANNDDPSAGDWSSNEDDQQEQDGSNSSDSDEAAEGDEDGEGDESQGSASSTSEADQQDSNEEPTKVEGMKASPSNDAANEDLESSSLSPDQLDELSSDTQDSLDSALRDMQNETHGSDRITNTPTNERLLDCVISWKEVHEARVEGANRYYNDGYNSNMNSFVNVEAWTEFKNATRKTVSILVKEFDRRKAAYQYSRATSARTGMLDVNKLHTYKYDDQIFKSVTALADAKSHGMIMLIDYSGSMMGQIANVVDQTIQLATFCSMVNIPFEVYAFTTPGRSYDREAYHDKWIAGQPGLHINLCNVEVRQMLSSTMKKKELDRAMKEMWIDIHCRSFNGQYDELCATPLTEALMVMHPLIEKFQKANRIQKLSFITITDGDGHGVQLTSDEALTRDLREVGIQKSYENDRTWATNAIVPWKGRMVHLGDKLAGPTTMLHSIKRSYGATIVGFFLTGSNKKSAHGHISRTNFSNRSHNENGERDTSVTPGNTVSYVTDLYDKAIDRMKKDRVKFALFADFGAYDEYYVLFGTSSTAIEDAELEVDPDLDLNGAAARGKLARAFTKTAGSKRSSRIFLTKFAEAIA